MSLLDRLPEELLDIIKSYTTFDYIQYKIFCNTCLWVTNWIHSEKGICCPNHKEHTITYSIKLQSISSNGYIIVHSLDTISIENIYHEHIS